jgi:ATP-dependent DNA helicase RecG
MSEFCGSLHPFLISEVRRLSLTDIRGLGIGTTQQAKAVADHRVRRKLLAPVGETRFQVPDALRKQFADAASTTSEQATEQVTPQVTPQVLALLDHAIGEMSRQSLSAALGLKDRKHFVDAYLQPALDAGLVAMTVPDKPRSSRQRYRLTERGQALLAGQQDKDKAPCFNPRPTSSTGR